MKQQMLEAEIAALRREWGLTMNENARLREEVADLKRQREQDRIFRQHVEEERAASEREMADLRAEVAELNAAVAAADETETTRWQRQNAGRALERAAVNGRPN